ncbi:DUF3618 domain-containing protein [Spirillospora sp. NPDC047279]|uniref:DUF3618 domain-containing protein n=1 Tax=Spirillospora sp. NPDC047279 TaxID=3155478 RepID=UPI00340F67C8
MTEQDQELEAQRKRAEEARTELGETMGELAARADVKHRAQEKAHEKAEEIKEKAGELKEKAGELKGRAVEVTPDPALKAAEQVRKRPGPVAGGAAALAAAILVGRQVLRRRRAAKAPKGVGRLFRKR